MHTYREILAAKSNGRELVANVPAWSSKKIEERVVKCLPELAT